MEGLARIIEESDRLSCIPRLAPHTVDHERFEDISSVQDISRKKRCNGRRELAIQQTG